MRNMPWRNAIIKILEESDSAMHYSDIAEKVVEDELRKSVVIMGSASLVTVFFGEYVF